MGGPWRGKLGSFQGSPGFCRCRGQAGPLGASSFIVSCPALDWDPRPRKETEKRSRGGVPAASPGTLAALTPGT